MRNHGLRRLHSPPKGVNRQAPRAGASVLSCARGLWGTRSRAPRPPLTRARSRGIALGAFLLSASSQLPACSADTSIVELDWAFVDHDGEPIFPGGSIIQNRDTCSLEGRDVTGTKDYALNVHLVIEDVACLEEQETAAEPDPSLCEVARETFDCDRARGAITGVPISDEPYLMRVEVWADPAGAEDEAFEVDTSCIAVPGPRTRKVEGGRITDLAVYQLVAHAIELDDAASGQLDLPACRVIESTPDEG